MQTQDDYGRRNSEETVRVEPQAVLDRFDEENSDASSSVSHENEEHVEQQNSPKPEENRDVEETPDKQIKTENDEQWEY